MSGIRAAVSRGRRFRPPAAYRRAHGTTRRSRTRWGPHAGESLPTPRVESACGRHVRPLGRDCAGDDGPPVPVPSGARVCVCISGTVPPHFPAPKNAISGTIRVSQKPPLRALPKCAANELVNGASGVFSMKERNPHVAAQPLRQQRRARHEAAARRYGYTGP